MKASQWRLALLLSVFCISSKAMAATDVDDFFPDIKGNLTKVSWAHAVNNSTLLNESLNNSKVMMLEADVQLGTLVGTSDVIPILAHPPATTSDLSLAGFLQNVADFNSRIDGNATSNRTRKGVKLDFKSIEAFNESLTIITQNFQGSYPLWINADILAGPVNATTVPVDPVKFLESAKNISNSTLSVGWTTNYGSNITASYSNEQITSMLNFTEQLPDNFTNRLTFAVRAGIAAESLEQMTKLVDQSKRNATLTVWSSEGDDVNVANLNQLILKVGVHRVFIDVPESLIDQLRLSTPSNGGTSLVVSCLTVIFMLVLVV